MIAVTGADGFVGRHLIARLVAEGERPRALVRDMSRARRVLPSGAVELVLGDVTRPGALAPTFTGVDTVIHAAFIVANRKQTSRANYHETNVVGTRNVVNAAKASGVQCIVEMGGLGTKPDKPGSYMQGRYEADQLIKNSGLTFSILGASVQFGQGSAFINGLADLIRSPLPVVPMIGSGHLRFQPIWVEDCVTCLLKMAREPETYNGRIIEVGGPEIYSYAQILDMLMRTLGKHKIKVPGPKPFAYLGALAMQTVLPNPPITTAALGLFDFDNVTALDAVQHNLGFQPMSFRSYLAEHGVE